MKARYWAGVDEVGVPVVRDRRRRLYSDQIVCYTVRMSIAKRIASALNQHEQRRLQLRERVKDIEAGR